MTQQLQKSIDFRRFELYEFHLWCFGVRILMLRRGNNFPLLSSFSHSLNIKIRTCVICVRFFDYSLRPHPNRPVYSKFFCAEKIKPLATKSAVRDCMNYKASGQHSTKGQLSDNWSTEATPQGSCQVVGTSGNTTGTAVR